MRSAFFGLLKRVLSARSELITAVIPASLPFPCRGRIHASRMPDGVGRMYAAPTHKQIFFSGFFNSQLKALLEKLVYVIRLM